MTNQNDPCCPDPSDNTPGPVGVANAGTASEYSRGDHTHAIDTGVVTTTNIAPGSITAELLSNDAAGYPTMAILRTVEPVNTRTVHTTSYAAPQDGGGGTWCGAEGLPPGTYVHDGGTVIVPTTGPSSDGSGAWVRQFEGERQITPAMFGGIAESGDSTAAVQAALNSPLDIVCVFDRRYRITGTVNVPAKKIVRGVSYVNTSTLGSVSGLIKAPFDGDAVTVGACALLSDFVVEFESGSSHQNDGIVIAANDVKVTRVAVVKATRDGFRLGADSGPSNANAAYLDGVIATECAQDGIHVSDKSATPPDANSVLIVKPHCRQNGRNGIRMGNAWMLTIIAPLLEGNSSYGFEATADAQWCDILGGDTEGNGGATGEPNARTDSNSRQIIWDSAQRREFHALPDGDDEPSVSCLWNVRCVNTSATIIKALTDGTKGQTLRVRLDGNTTIQANSQIATVDGLDVTGDANSLIEFLRVDNVWRETWRNFTRARVYKPTESGRVGHWMRGDDPNADFNPGSPDTLVSIPNIGEFGLSAAGSWSAAGSAPDYVTRHGKKCPLFNATSKRLQSNQASSYFRGFHNPDSTAAVHVRFRVDTTVNNGQVLATSSYSNTGAGFGLILFTTTLYLYIANGSGGATPLGMLSAGPSLSANTDYTVQILKQRGHVAWWVDGTFIGEADLTSPSRANPAYALVIGNVNGGGNPLNGPVYEVVTHASGDLIDVYDLDQMRNYLARWS